MIVALVILGTVVLCVVAVKASEHLRHAENIEPKDGPDADRDLSAGSDRPAGPDAEDPPTAVPNRTRTQPPTGST